MNFIHGDVDTALGSPLPDLPESLVEFKNEKKRKKKRKNDQKTKT